MNFRSGFGKPHDTGAQWYPVLPLGHSLLLAPNPVSTVRNQDLSLFTTCLLDVFNLFVSELFVCFFVEP